MEEESEIERHIRVQQKEREEKGEREINSEREFNINLLALNAEQLNLPTRSLVVQSNDVESTTV